MVPAASSRNRAGSQAGCPSRSPRIPVTRCRIDSGATVQSPNAPRTAWKEYSASASDNNHSPSANGSGRSRSSKASCPIILASSLAEAIRQISACVGTAVIRPLLVFRNW